MGELYRMNLSCSGEGFPESGCFFFKAGGRTIVSNGECNIEASLL